MALEVQLQHLCKQQGILSLPQFMQYVMHGHHAELQGYYRHAPAIGARGDFTTAPEISQIFGEIIGAWCAQAWIDLGSPTAFTLVELGPGRGTLMQDLLRVTAKLPGFHEALSLYLVESNPTLQAQQIQRFATYSLRGHLWVQDLEQLPDLPTLVIANEFFDAQPIATYRYTEEGWQSLGIRWEDLEQRFVLVWQQVPPVLAQVLHRHYPNLHYGDIIEQSETAARWLTSLCKVIHAQGGAGIICDYGYDRTLWPFPYHPTLQALYKHRPCSIVEHIGAADISAHVDFAFLRSVMHAHTIPTFPTMTQGEFLMRNGAKERLIHLCDPLQRQDPPYREAITELEKGFHRLTAPEEMGELFKVLTFTTAIL